MENSHELVDEFKKDLFYTLSNSKLKNLTKTQIKLYLILLEENHE